MVSTAFKPGQDVLSLRPAVWLPRDPTLANFRDAITRPYFWYGVRNSLIVVLSVVALSIVLAFLAALALAKFRFYGRRPFIVLIIARADGAAERADHPALHRAQRASARWTS